MGESEEWEIESVSEFSIILYKLNDEEERFDRVDIENVEDVYPHLVSGNILIVIDKDGQNAYLWVGSESTIHMKFLAARIAPETRDKHGTMSTMQLHNLEESSESDEFKKLLRLS